MEHALASALGVLEQVDLVAGAAQAITPEAPIVFEGAQRLMLDQARGAFPHVTRSNTGLANVLDVAADLGIARIEAVYASRAYVTGTGPARWRTSSRGRRARAFQSRPTCRTRGREACASADSISTSWAM